jgi:hypothetical protein
MVYRHRLDLDYIIRAILIACLASILLFIGVAVTKAPLSFKIVEIIRTVAMVSILPIVAVEIWDSYTDKYYDIRRFSGYLFGGNGPGGIVESYFSSAVKTVFNTGVIMLLAIAVVGFSAGGYSMPVIIVGILIGTYVALPSTGDDYWLLGLWIGCVVMCVVTGAMGINELIDYQTLGPALKAVGGI